MGQSTLIYIREPAERVEFARRHFRDLACPYSVLSFVLRSRCPARPTSALQISELLLLSAEMIQTGLIPNAHNDLVTDASYDFYGLHLATCSLDQRSISSPSHARANVYLGCLCVE